MIDIKLYIAKALKILLNPPALRNCSISKKAKVCSKSELTNVKMDDYSYIGNQCFMVDVSIGRYCSIADKCCIGGVMHPIDRVSTSPVFQKGNNILKHHYAYFDRPEDVITVIENDVWIGMGSYIKGGVSIRTGAVIGMGSVVTQDIPAYEIWAGNPARKIRDRFPTELKNNLLNSRWWNMDDLIIKDLAKYFDDPAELLRALDRNNGFEEN